VLSLQRTLKIVYQGLSERNAKKTGRRASEKSE